ncbi:MAG: LLM class flavin-dependent oxidoreductase [Proteobacteria bacterium]|nr:LLM class flavin-dependent oxidoreductase [Pseudomonadota bacterium]
MEFGLQFFPTVGPSEMSGQSYFEDCLELVALCDELGYRHVRTVEHYFHEYGGYSPNPLIFLTAAAARTKLARLITGAILPVFNHPLKIASEIAMVDALTGGRLETGFGRAFIPHEFERYGISLDESRARFNEGLAQITQLLEEENVTCDGQFHSFKNTTVLPRPTQSPRPQFWVATTQSEESIAAAARAGHWIMAIPLTGGVLKPLIQLYRETWKEAKHPGEGKVMLSYHVLCWPDEVEAADIARPRLNAYLKAFGDSAGDWTAGTASADYPGYDKMIAFIKSDTFDNAVERGAAWVGTPEKIIDQIRSYDEAVGHFDVASLQMNFHGLPTDITEKSARLFSEKVIPHFAD